jgi:ABC-type dipeptide/oligopeptide/nickel transport system permease component
MMIFSLDIWLLPAIAASSSSYLVSLIWERFKAETAPSGPIAALLSILSFVMGAVSAYFRHRMFQSGIEDNVIVMFIVGASTTYFWLLLRKYLPGIQDRKTRS